MGNRNDRAPIDEAVNLIGFGEFEIDRLVEAQFAGAGDGGIASQGGALESSAIGQTTKAELLGSQLRTGGDLPSAGQLERNAIRNILEMGGRGIANREIG